MGTIGWLHISDLHLKSDTQSSPSGAYGASIVLEKLLDDLKSLINNNELKIDFIVISGDIAFSGKREEYMLVKQFFDNILEITELTKDRLFPVPGNHDIDRSISSKLSNDLPKILKDREIVNDTLANEQERKILFNKFNSYKNFVLEYFKGENAVLDSHEYYYVASISILDKNIVILGLNSAWACNLDDNLGQLILGEMQVRDALKASKDSNLLIALMHHPFYWLKEFDRKIVDPLLCKKCNFILQGHMHETGILQINGPDSKAMTISAGACYKGIDYQNSYNIVQLNLDERIGKIYLRSYSDNGGGFWTRDVTSYEEVDNGEYHFQFPESLCKSLGIQQEDIAIQQKDNVRIENFLYFRNLFFTDRESCLRRMRDEIDKSKIILLCGMPGIGKTQIVSEYISKYKNYYDIIWWLRSEDPLVLKSDYLRLALELKKLDSNIDAVKSCLERTEKWLIIFDRAQSFIDIKEFIPKSGTGHIIITSINPFAGEVVNPIYVKPFNRLNSIKLIKKIIVNVDETSANKLAEALGDHPLGLSQAGVYIRERKNTVADYLKELDSGSKVLLSKGVLENYEHSITCTLAIAINCLRRESPLAHDLLKLCAFFGPGEIPRMIFILGNKSLPEPLRSAVSNDISMNEIVRTLVKYSLIEATNESMLIHKLVQQVLLYLMTTDEKRVWLKVALLVLKDALESS